MEAGAGSGEIWGLGKSVRRREPGWWVESVWRVWSLGLLEVCPREEEEDGVAVWMVETLGPHVLRGGSTDEQVR